MAERTPRIMYQNFCSLGATAIRASSEDLSFPRTWLRDPLPTKPWRSKSGYNIVADFNDAIEILEGTTKRVAFLTPGNYATPGDLATHATSAINAAGRQPYGLTPSGWYRASHEDIADSGAMVNGTGWRDVSGNLRHMSTVVGSVIMNRYVLNGRPAVRFGSGYVSGAAANGLLSASMIGTAYSVFFIDSTTTLDDWIWSHAGFRGLYLTTSNQLKALAYDGSFDQTAGFTCGLGSWHIAVWQYDGTDVKCWLDDMDDAAAQTAASGAQTNTTGNVTLGDTTAGTSATMMKGWAPEHLFFNTAHTQQSRRQIVMYLKQRFQLTDNTTAHAWTNTYAATYDTSARKFTFARTAGGDSMAMPFSSGEFSAFEGAGPEFGFAATDLTAATTYTGDASTRHSREFLEFDFGAAQSVTVMLVGAHNIVAAASVSVRRSSTGVFYQGVLEDIVPGSADPLITFPGAKSGRYWRVMVTDVDNPATFTQFGLVYLGPYFQPARSVGQGYDDNVRDLSSFTESDQGGIFQDKKPMGRVWAVVFHRLPTSNRDSFVSMQDSLGKGRPFWFALDPLNYPEQARYVYLYEDLRFKHSVGDGAPPDRWTVQVTVREQVT